MGAGAHQIYILAECLAVLVLTLLTLSIDGYSITIPADPSNPGKCVYRSEDLKPGINIGPLPCQQLTCNEDGSVLVEGCGKINLKDCNRGERIHIDQPYPACCKQRFKCKRPDGSSYYQEKNIV
ncbi:uncharacterized protein LOC129948127 [Eupeodes corollae]|uniref:uncharacterized protein LOC129948127 n=1 Tax=Eupeodes corollae TaxID=290404 RepID=UPI00248F7B6F|nr:uncharacterized protein LOC129948127 [Eupeodes corollae]XP_055914957.1 uncharacterized protein LOC129948127 [Eupeodes corollae]